MAKWITDRHPNEADAGNSGYVWATCNDGTVICMHYTRVLIRMPWMPMQTPDPYVKPEPQRWRPLPYEHHWMVITNGEVCKCFLPTEINEEKYSFGNCFQTRAQAEEAAQRVRETLLNYHKDLSNE